MKTPISLLSVAQLVAIFQIAFGVMFSTLTSDSDILGHIRDKSIRDEVRQWHERTTQTASRWFVGLGATLLVLTSSASAMLRNSN